MTKKSKLFLGVLLCTSMAMPLVHEIPDAFMSPIVKQSSTEKINRSIYDIRTTEGTDIYMAAETVNISSSNEGDGIKKIEKGQFITLTKNGMIPDTKSKIISGQNDMVKVPDNLHVNFSIMVKGTYKSKPLKLFAAADDRTELSSDTKRPDYYYTNDLNIYNGHYLKVKDDENHTLYVDTNQADWSTFTTDKFKIIGDAHNMEVIHGERNFTTNVSARTNFSYDDLIKITHGTGLEGLEHAVIETEEKYGVNALFTLALAAHESGWGSSSLARNRNNLFGICAFDSNVDAASSFGTKSECIDYFGRLISKEYFAHGRTNLWSINEIYASDPSWASQVQTTMLYMMNMIKQ